MVVKTLAFAFHSIHSKLMLEMRCKQRVTKRGPLIVRGPKAPTPTYMTDRLHGETECGVCELSLAQYSCAHGAE